MATRTFYKIIRIVRALSLVNSCVKRRVCKHGCDISRILIGYVLSDARFDWLVGNMRVCQENLFQSKSDWENSRQLCKPSTSSRVCITISNSPNPSPVYIRLCKHGKLFLLLKSEIVNLRYSNHFVMIPTHWVFQMYMYINCPEIKMV